MSDSDYDCHNFPRMESRLRVYKLHFYFKKNPQVTLITPCLLSQMPLPCFRHRTQHTFWSRQGQLTMFDNVD